MTPQRVFNMVDLFSGAGGAAMGYYQSAPFRVVGVDIVKQPRYPFTFRQDDAMELLRERIDVFQSWADFVHISPPCQGYSRTRYLWDIAYPKLIGPVRELVRALDIPYVIENVDDARPYMREPITLCGSSFGLRVRRHRLFESNMPLKSLPCNHRWQDEHRPYKIHMARDRYPEGFRRSGVQPIFGGNQNVGGDERFLKSVAMGIDWMKPAELNEAIPPAYTRHLGIQVYDYLLANA